MRTKPQILFASSRMLIGLTFIVSGLTKGLDLFSTSLKVQEYFEALGLSPNGGLPYITACLLIATELFLGMLMTFGILKNVAVKAVSALTLFFLVLTSYMYIGNLMQDCGCFGGIFSLTIKDTIFKNAALLILCGIALMEKSHCQESPKRCIVPLILSCSTGFYGLFVQPLYDTSPYHVGRPVSIEDWDIEPFASNNDLQISLHEKIKKANSFVFIIVRDMENANESKLKVVVNQINKLTLTNKDNVMLLTSTPLKNIKEREFHHIHIGNIDNSLSRKIIQSNLGFVILKGGVIENKWQQNSLGLQTFH